MDDENELHDSNYSKLELMDKYFYVIYIITSVSL